MRTQRVEHSETGTGAPAAPGARPRSLLRRDPCARFSRLAIRVLDNNSRRLNFFPRNSRRAL
eukprot:4036471-Pyramimonas_sp.AAC.1